MLRAGPVAGLGGSSESRPDPLRQLLFERYRGGKEADEGVEEPEEAALE
jgi:hypothetical protein